MRRTATYSLVITYLAVIFASLSNIHAQNDEYQLEIRSVHGEFQNVKCQIQYYGTVSIDNDGDENGANHLPLDVQARFDFDQQLSGTDTNLQAIRFYKLANGNIKAGKGQKKSKLDETNRYIVGRIKTNQNRQNLFQFASIGSMLNQSEYELLKHPADPLTLVNLINQRAKVGETWDADPKRIGRFLALDRVISSNIKLKLKSVNNGIAKIQLFGDIRGEVDDVVTELETTGEITIDIQQKKAIATRLSFNQIRDPGQVAPGFEGQVKVDLQVKSIDYSKDLSKSKISKIAKGNKIRQQFILSPEGSQFALIHAPQWRTIVSEPEAAILRYIDNGDLLAQCNIVQLPNRPADQPLKLAEFESEVKKMLGKSEVEIKSANKATTKNGLQALRVMVIGEESGVAVQWLYYHVSHTDGRRLTFVFTMEQDIADRFSTADQVLVNQLKFKPAPKRQSKSKPATTKR